MGAATKMMCAFAAAALCAACGSAPEMTVETDPKTRTYTVVDLHYQPTLAAACAGLDLEAPKFSFDSAELSAEDRVELAKLASCVKRDALADETLVVVGHTDPRGTKAYNRDLGRERAQSVREVLMAHGVPGHRIRIESHGESEASPKPWDWPAERRVDIGITDGGTWTFVETEISETTPGKVVQGTFEERADTDGDGVAEPTVYPAGSSPQGTSSFAERGDPDRDGADEPEATD